LACFLGAQDENWTFHFLYDFFGYRAERNSAPPRHAMGRDHDHIGVISLRDSYDFHPDIIGGADFRACLNVLTCKARGDVGQTLLCRVMEALLVFPP
jgi:hypothetical protein